MAQFIYNVTKFYLRALNNKTFCRLFSDKRQFIGELRLSDWFGRPITIEENTCGLTTGLTTQPQNGADRFYDSEISQYFFRYD